MLLRALLCEVAGLTPEAKYFLARFIQCFGVTDPVGLGVKELARQFGLTDRQVSAALAALLACNVLSCASVPDGRGRPKRRYSLQATFLRNLSKCPQPTNTQHVTAIGHLLKHESRGRSHVADAEEEVQKAALDKLASLRAKRQSGRLSIVNRLLLGVLLCHADRLGAIRNLGSAELRKVTGLAQEGLKHRIQRLVDQGLIRAYVPGATGRVMFGRAKSAYFLNLAHPELSEGCRTAAVLVCRTLVVMGKHMLDEADTLFNASCSNDVRAWFGQARVADRVSQIINFFPRREMSRVSPILQCRLENYASALLSEHWAQLPSSDCFIDPPPAELVSGLLERMAAEFRPSQKAMGNSEQFPAEQCRALLIEHLCEDAFRLACRVKRVLTRVQGIPFDALDYLILPHAGKWPKKNLLSRSVLALTKGSSAVRGCYVVIDKANPQYFEREDDIPLNDRYRYGLLTKPVASKASAIGSV